LQIEHGIATQRLRLSRLVAGLLLAVNFLSFLPFSSESRHWLQRALLSVLTRAECAAYYLVIAQAGVLAVRAGVFERPSQFYAAMGDLGGPDFSSCEAGSYFAPLERRLKILRAMLADLPRYAVRLLRRVLSAGESRTRARGASFAVGFEVRLSGLRLAAEPIEKPPDKAPVPLPCC